MVEGGGGGVKEDEKKRTEVSVLEREREPEHAPRPWLVPAQQQDLVIHSLQPEWPRWIIESLPCGPFCYCGVPSTKYLNQWELQL